MTTTPKPCPCGNNNTVDQCCMPIINNNKQAATAEELMRSRYTAYTLGEVDYLLRSHHKSTRPNKDRKEILRWSKSVKWLGLTIKSKTDGLSAHTSGTVEFQALYIESGRIQEINEHSLFIKEDNIWYYKSGTHQ